MPNYKDLQILVAVTDNNGRRFNNFSSLAFQWELTDVRLAAFLNNAEMQSEVVISGLGRKTTKGIRAF